MPRGIPSSREINVAEPDILIESQVIAQTSASNVNTSSMAFKVPCQINSTLSSQLLLFFPSYGHKKRLAKLLDSESADHVLGLRRDHEIGKRFSAF